MIINSRLPELLDCVKQEFESIQSESQSLKAQTQEFESHLTTCTTDLSHLREQLFHLDREHQKLKTQYEEELRRLHLELEQRSSTTVQGPSNQLSSHDPRGPPNLSQSSNPSGPAGSFGTSTPSSNNIPNRGEYDSYPNGGSRNNSTGDNPSNLPEHPSKRLRIDRDRTAADNDLDPRGAGAPGSASGAGGPPLSHNPNVGMTSSPVLPHPVGRGGPEASKNKLKPNDSQYSKLPNPNASHSYGGNPYHSSRAEAHIPPPSSHHHPGPPVLPSGGGSQAVIAGPNQSSGGPLQQVPPSNNGSNHSNVLLDIDPETLPSNMKKEGPDWLTMFNPNVKKVLDVGLVHTLVHDSVVCCVKFSPDGTILATGCNRFTSLYNTRTGSKICQLLDETHGNKGDNYIRSASFSPDGKYLATGSEDRIIRIWDVGQKRIINRFQGHKSEIYSLAFSPDGRILVSGSGDKTARIWDMGSGNCLFHLVIEETLSGTDSGSVDAGVTSVCVSPDGSLLAAGSLDTIVRLWNTSNGQLLDKLKGHKDSVYSVAFSPDGKFLVSGSLDKTLKLWDLSTLNRDGNPSFNSIVKKEDSSSNNNNPSNQSSSGPISSTNTNNNSNSGSNNLGSGDRGENGEKITSDRGFDSSRSSTVCTTTLAGHKDYVLSVAVSPDGEWIMSGSKDRGVQFWDPKTAKPQFMLQGHKNSVISIAVSDSGGLLATGSGDWHARIWSYERVVKK